MKLNVYKYLSLVLIAALFVPKLELFAAFNGKAPMAYGMNTVAGTSTFLKAEGMDATKAVSFSLRKPDGSLAYFPAQTDNSGNATVAVSEYHTRKSGVYGAAVQYQGSIIGDAQFSNFTVESGKVSAGKSLLQTQKTLVSLDGTDNSEVLVALTDDFGNAVAGHVVQLISSRGNDKIATIAGADAVTDALGQMHFQVSSIEKGVSVYSAYDVTAHTVIEPRVQIAYTDKTQFLSNVGGNENSFFTIASADSIGQVHHFLIDSIAASVAVNQDVSFKVSALDQAGQIVSDYNGTVHFSTDGLNPANVTLPVDYTFTAADQGVHQFSLGLSFKSPGSYKVIVTDLANQLVRGEKVVAVAVANNQAPGTTLNPTIVSPSTGIYNSKTQTVSGTAPLGMTIKFYDNEKELGSSPVDSSGQFSYQTPSLADGSHKIKAVAFDSANIVQGTSNTVEISVDTTPPSMDQITLDPATNFKAGENVTVTVLSAPGLGQASLVFNGAVIQLSNGDGTGTYSAIIQTPQVNGVYPLDVMLVDQLNNQASLKAVAQITINDGGVNNPPIVEKPKETQMEVPPVEIGPSKVANVLAYPGNEKVVLVWDAASAPSSIVKRYRIFYGFDPYNLNLAVDTKDAATTWYVPKLSNGKQYYFALTAIDQKGKESAVRSSVVSATPYQSEIVKNVGEVVPKPLVLTDFSYNPFFFDDNDGNLHSAFDQAVAPKINEVGPEVLWLLGGSGLFGVVLRKFRKKFKAPKIN